jgi:hypothetical protein
VALVELGEPVLEHGQTLIDAHRAAVDAVAEKFRGGCHETRG